MATTTVFFDVGNTLIRPTLSEVDVLMDSAGKLGVEVDRALLEKGIFEMMTDYDKLFKPDDSLWATQEGALSIYLSIFEKACEAAGVTGQGRGIAETTFAKLSEPSAWKPFDDVIETLDGLKSQGIRMGLISNWDLSLESVIRGIGLGDYFETIIASAAVGLYKPQPEIFELALQKMGVCAAQARHVGDNLTADIAGARGVGIMPVLIDRVDKHDIDDGTIKLGKLTDLLAHIV